ncbi:DUF4097 family beta strand repeat-containing protein [Marinicella litoralis]|uniref:Putative adhesin n=1 Tax=Marinicella litoralis TaxID=644220 RepID=A0A4R6XWG7_9GAMM|nr:DUF4097 family beta strand repeat-containing protein [Marinicella litoralis]TDR22584.1 putative adhesin [Marinicella litoralis]
MQRFNLQQSMFALCCFVSPLVLAKGAQVAQFAQTESFNESLQFEQKHEDNQLIVFNVYGSVDVEGHDGDEIIIMAKNTVAARTQKLVDLGLDEIGLKIETQGQKIFAYLDSPYTYIDLEAGKVWHSDTCWRHDDCSRKHPERKDYKYHMDLVVKVPQHTNIQVSTINAGDITVSGVHAKSLMVDNINGAIDMVNVSGQTRVNSINKDINVAFSRNPTDGSQFQSINGDINITFADSPDAIVVYQTMHGEMYSAFDVSMMAPELQRTSQKKEHGIQYKLDAENRLMVGKGGPEYRFETLNGDIKIQRQ